MAEVARDPTAAIVFTGFMAAGKSEAARAAAERLGAEAVDVDRLLERELGEPIEAYFERHGEAEFRRREEELVLRLLDQAGGPGGSAVLALGGGAVESERVRDALGRHLCAWCRVDEETAWERSRDSARPLAADRDRFGRRYRERLPLYEEVARAVLPEGGAEIGRSSAPWLDAMRSRQPLRMAWARSASGSYPAFVGAGALEVLDSAREAGAEVPERLFRVADRAALEHHQGLLPHGEATIEVAGEEGSKTIAEAERVLRELAAAGARRDDAILAFGGGVVGDLAGFCAATYQRGASLVQAPTTPVAQVDSAYGGKTGVDLPEAKNYVGAYHLPLAVLAEPRTLVTLPPKELAAGFVEVLKTALIAGGELWERVRQIERLDPEALADVVFACARVKIDIVAADERDSGQRAVLNLGHTVGHAIESASGYGRYRHGEAVGLGLLAALRLSYADQLRDEIEARLRSLGLPTTLDSGISVESVIEATARDKKRGAEGLGFVLLERPGEPRWGVKVEADRVRAVVEELHET
jgi:3-dehydroquinate synthetase/shikimate kinase